MKVNNISKYAAILGAILFFILSTVRLIYFAVSSQALNKADSKIAEFAVRYYRDLNVSLIISLLLISVVIFSYYFFYAKRENQRLLKIFVILSVIGTILFSMYELSRFLEILSWFPLSQDEVKLLLSISTIFFASSLLFYRKNRKKTLLIIAPLYILQSAFILSTLFLPVQLLDLMVAIRMAEAVFLHQENNYV